MLPLAGPALFTTAAGSSAAVATTDTLYTLAVDFLHIDTAVITFSYILYTAERLP